MKLESPAFTEGSTIPMQYTCEGGGIPPLVFSKIPQGAKTLALVIDDVTATADVRDHFVVWNIPAAMSGVIEGKTLDAVVGRNSWMKNAWGAGPCSRDQKRCYAFRLYALDTEIELTREATRADLERAMDDHVLAEIAITGYCDQASC
jgi:Raf kinase inhibitor-like YbhB/YbcL family protein